MKMKIALASITLCLFTSTVGFAVDMISIGTKQHEGSFEGFKDDSFFFRTDKGEMLNPLRRNVRRLELGEPCKVCLNTVKNGSKSALLTKYKTLKFTFQEGKKDKKVFASKIISITIDRPEQENNNNRATNNGDLPIAQINVSDLEKMDNLTIKQTSALKEYKQARSTYDEFLRISSKMVADMDKKKGRSRDKLLQKLQFRKNEEQPIKNTLNAATSKLRAQFQL